MARVMDGNDMNLVGGRIRELRTARKLSQQALSNRQEALAIYVCRAYSAAARSCLV